MILATWGSGLLIVLDASAAVAVFIGLEPGATHIRERIAKAPDGTLHVPHLFDIEVLHALRRLTLGSLISESRSLRALEALSDVRVTRYPHGPLVARVWELRENLTAYDAAYVALAEALDAPLVTTDGKLARTPGHYARVELYP